MVEYVWTCTVSGCGIKVHSNKRGYARIKAFNHLYKEHCIKSISYQELDKDINELPEYKCDHSDRMYKSINDNQEQCCCCGNIRNIR